MKRLIALLVVSLSVSIPSFGAKHIVAHAAKVTGKDTYKVAKYSAKASGKAVKYSVKGTSKLVKSAF